LQQRERQRDQLMTLIPRAQPRTTSLKGWERASLIGSHAASLQALHLDVVYSSSSAHARVLHGMRQRAAMLAHPILTTA
jgi:hypothetical protein